MEDKYLLRLANVEFSYGQQKILNEVSLAIATGEIACLVGPSGCGKSTLLRCIAGFEKIAAGEISIGGRLVADGQKINLPPEQRGVGVVFQEYALFPHLTVFDNIAFGLRRHSKSAVRERVNELIESTQLGGLAERYPNELSGGQQQRVALARALAPQPAMILLDEPFSNLDPELRERMKAELKSLLTQMRVTALVVTHNQDEAFDLADQLGVLTQGSLRQWGHPYDVYHYPHCRKVADFLGLGAFLPVAKVGDDYVDTELGRMPCHTIPKARDVEVFLRPDDIVHDDRCAPLATVVRVAFRGMYRIYELALPSGRRIFCFTSSHHELHPIGSKIGIRLDVRHVVVLPTAEGSAALPPTSRPPQTAPKGSDDEQSNQ